MNAGMWGGFKRADPVAAAKRNKINNKLSIGFGPRRDYAGQRLTKTALNGELRIYVANESEAGELFEHTIVPVEILKRLITVRETLPDHPKKRPAQRRHWSLERPSWLRLRSIRANSPSPNPNACVTRRT